MPTTPPSEPPRVSFMSSERPNETGTTNLARCGVRRLICEMGYRPSEGYYAILTIGTAHSRRRKGHKYFASEGSGLHTSSTTT
jgi:hypothetical protein